MFLAQPQLSSPVIVSSLSLLTIYNFCQYLYYQTTRSKKSSACRRIYFVLDFAVDFFKVELFVHSASYPPEAMSNGDTKSCVNCDCQRRKSDQEDNHKVIGNATVNDAANLRIYDHGYHRPSAVSSKSFIPDGDTKHMSVRNCSPPPALTETSLTFVITMEIIRALSASDEGLARRGAMKSCQESAAEQKIR
ncbi:uncharacterized protein BT62DRAFT_1080703 [Guyanagaster necrorhizus]|uniref:Uncharacterized protein n=1 Tax=Guyanagaster necrorhizus TaxID=856835 RepID=A0A9P7VHB5_9AGAR|nr:uncharacterized protein BT62DRAFT_1080703 [Guyanagaster necrorhizus MCA 3950]KAG7440709.1 hypothetical protein BT62DRAFT_1080703 [Guyanagaster necrorhizus MCA 3950]